MIWQPRWTGVSCTISDDELAGLLHEARQVSKTRPLGGITLHTIVGLAASTGLRISEVVRLDRADVDLATGVLLIRIAQVSRPAAGTGGAAP